MKRNILARRAASAALAACMMFSLSAPALAASTDALLQQSTAAKSAVSVLDEENGTAAEPAYQRNLNNGSIKVNNKPVTNENYKDILGNGKLWYDDENNVIKSKGRLNGTIIDAPGVDVDLNGGDYSAVINNKLVVSNAHDVTVSSNKFAALGEGAEINCTGKVVINALGQFSNYAIGARSESAGRLVITGATSVEINAPQYDQIVGGLEGIVDITCDGPVTIRGNAKTGEKIANSFTYKRTDRKNYVYYTSEGADEGAIDASVTPIPSDVPYRYLRIEEKQNARIKVNNGTVTVGDTTEAQLDSFKGQKVKVTATGAESDDRKFDGWEVVAPDGFTIDADKLREKSFEFIMPAGEVELTAHYASKLSVTGGTAKVENKPVDFARKDAAVTVTADDRGEDYKFDHWELSEDSAKIDLNNEQLKNATLNFPMPDGPVKLTAVYSAAVTVVNGIAEAGTESGETIFVLQGEKVTVSGKNENPSVTKFGGWKVISPESFELTEEQKNTEKNMTFTMPASPVELKASYSFPAPVLDMQVTVKGGTIRVGEGESQTGTVFVQPGQTVTIEANEPVKENESFHHWKVENGTSTAFAPTEGSLGSETEKGTEKIVFTMPQDGVKLTAVYSVPASVLRSTVTVEGGTAKSTLGEGSDIPAEIGTTVEITATPYDAEKYPGMEFVEWEIKYPDSFYEKFPGGIPENLQLKLDNAKSATTTFKMPVYPVKLIAHWSASAVDGPDEPLDPDFGVEPAPMDTTGGTIAAVAVGGAAIWGGYEIATRVILHNLLPEGAAIPANRGQLALLIWTEKGKPEPAAQPAFADITDAEQAKAAQWCVEQGLLDAREGKFESDGWMPKFKTIEIWNKAFPKK